jgi:hypothetical protein
MIDKRTDARETALDAAQRKALADRLRGLTAQPGQAATPDPRQEAALEAISSLPLEQGQQVAGQAAMGQLFPKPAEPYNLPPGGQRRGPGNELLAEAPFRPEPTDTPSTGRFGSPQPDEQGNMWVLDRMTGKYVDAGMQAAANMRLVTLPDGSVQLVDMRAPATPDQPRPTQTVVTPDTAITAATDKERAVTTAREGAEITTQAAADLPRVEQNAHQAMQAIDQLLAHPGFSGIFGKSGMLQPQMLPGTDWADANALLNQIKGKTFLEAFQTLKGGGQITELEGTKAEQAIARLDRAQSDDAAKLALLELKEIAQLGVARARQRAGLPPSQPQQQTPTDISALLDKYAPAQ